MSETNQGFNSVRCSCANSPQVSSGNLERSYRRAPKAAGEEGGAEAHDGAGICHLCMAGQGVEWENLPLGLNCVSLLFYMFLLDVGWLSIHYRLQGLNLLIPMQGLYPIL